MEFVVKELERGGISKEEIDQGLEFVKRRDGGGFVGWLEGLEKAHAGVRQVNGIRFMLDYLMGGVEQLMLIRLKSRKDVLKILEKSDDKLKESTINDLLQGGRKYGEVDEQDFVKALVGTTSGLDSPKGTIRAIVAKQMKVAPLNENVVIAGGKLLGVTDKKEAEKDATIFNAANGVHIAGFSELIREVSLMYNPDARRIAVEIGNKKPQVDADTITDEILRIYRYNPDKKEIISKWVIFIGLDAAMDILSKIYRHPNMGFAKRMKAFFDEMIKSKDGAEIFARSPETDRFIREPARFTRILMRQRLTEKGDADGKLVKALMDSIQSDVDPEKSNKAAYEKFRDKIHSENNAAAYLKSGIRNKTLFDTFPEIRDLDLLCYEKVQDYATMMAHTMRILDNLQILDDAARIEGAIVKAKQRSDDKKVYELTMQLEEAFESYKERSDGQLAALTKEGFMDLVSLYGEIARLTIEAPPETGKINSVDGRTLIWMLVLLHDMGKSDSWPQHIELSAQMLKMMLKRFGWHDKLIGLAATLVNNHSLISRVGLGEDSYFGLKEFTRAANGVTVTDPKGELIGKRQAFINIMGMLNIADIRGVGPGGKFTPEKLSAFVKFSRMTPKELKDKIRSPELRYSGIGLAKKIAPKDEFFKQMIEILKGARSKGVGIDRDKISNELKARGITYLEFLADMMASDEGLAIQFMAGMSEWEKKYVIGEPEMGERLANLMLRRDTMPKVTDPLERKVRIAMRVKRARAAIEDGRDGLNAPDAYTDEEIDDAIRKGGLVTAESIKGRLDKMPDASKMKWKKALVSALLKRKLLTPKLTQFENFLAQSHFSYLDAAAGAMEKDESLVKLLVVLWKVWQVQVGADRTAMGPLLYIAFETLERDEILRKGAVAALENSLKNFKINKIAGSDIDELYKDPVSYTDAEVDAALKEKYGSQAGNISGILGAIPDEKNKIAEHKRIISELVDGKFLTPKIPGYSLSFREEPKGAPGAQNKVIVCTILAEGVKIKKTDKTRPIAVERYSYIKVSGELEKADKASHKAISDMESSGRILIEDSKLDVGEVHKEQRLNRINNKDEAIKQKERDEEKKRVEKSLKAQGLLPAGRSIDDAIDLAMRRDTVIRYLDEKDNNKEKSKVLLRPLVLEDMTPVEAAAIIGALYKMGETLKPGEIAHIVYEEDGAVKIEGPDNGKDAEAAFNNALAAMKVDRTQLGRDNKTVYELRKESRERIDMWSVDWEKELKEIETLDDEALVTELKQESIIADMLNALKGEKNNWFAKTGLVSGLWDKFIGSNDDKKGGLQIRESLKKALKILYTGQNIAIPEDDTGLMNFILNTVRPQIESKFMDGVDMIKNQHRGVAEIREANKAWKDDKKDEDERRKGAKKLLLQARALEIEAIRLALTAVAMMAIELAEEGKPIGDPGIIGDPAALEAEAKDETKLLQADYNRHYGVVPVIIASGEGSRRSPDNQMNKSFDEILGTSNVNKLYGAISFMSRGIRPVVTLGKNTLTSMLNREGMYNEAKKILAASSGTALEEIDENVVSFVKSRGTVPDNAILIIKEDDEAGGHGSNTHMAMEVYAKGNLEVTGAHRRFVKQIRDLSKPDKLDRIYKIVDNRKNKPDRLDKAMTGVAAALWCLKHEEGQDVKAIIEEMGRQKRFDTYEPRIKQLYQYYEGRIDGAKMKDIGMFQVHFGEHSPLELDTMVHTGFVAFLKGVSERTVATTCSRQSLEIKNKGNFVFDSVGRQLMLGDWHKIMMIVDPGRIRSGEVERRIEQLKKEASFYHPAMDEVLDLLREIKKKIKEIDESKEGWSRISKETKKEMAPLTKKLSEKLQELFNAAIKAKVISGPNIDKDGKTIEKDIELLSFIQELLSDKKNALIAERGPGKAFMPINTNKTIFTKELWEQAMKTNPKDGTQTSLLFDYPSAEDPTKFDIGFLAWEYTLVMSEKYRQTSPADRRKQFPGGGYPVSTVDQGLVGFEPKSFERSGLKDIKTVNSSINDFVEYSRRQLPKDTVEADDAFLFTMMDGRDVLAKGNRKTYEEVFRKGGTIRLEGLFYHDFHSTIESERDRPTVLENVSIKRSYISAGSEIKGEEINCILRNAYLGWGDGYKNLYARDTVIPEGRQLEPVAGSGLYEVVGMMAPEIALAGSIESKNNGAERKAFIDEVIRGAHDGILNFKAGIEGPVREAGRLTSIAAALWYLGNIAGKPDIARGAQTALANGRVNSIINALDDINGNISLAQKISSRTGVVDKIAEIDRILGGGEDPGLKISAASHSYEKHKLQERILAIAQTLWAIDSFGGNKAAGTVTIKEAVVKELAKQGALQDELIKLGGDAQVILTGKAEEFKFEKTDKEAPHKINEAVKVLIAKLQACESTPAISLLIEGLGRLLDRSKLHKEIANAFDNTERELEYLTPVIDSEGATPKIEPEFTAEMSDFIGKINDTRPVMEDAVTISKDRLSELYDHVTKKGGAIVDKNGKHFELKLAGKINTLYDLIGSKNFKGEDCSDGTRLFGNLNMDTTSHIGNTCYIWDVMLRHAYVGKGWGLRDCDARNTVFSDHSLKARTHPGDSEKFTMLLQAHRNDGNMYAYTAAIGSTFDNSYIGVNSGHALRGMSNRRAYINVRAIDTIIPEGRNVPPGSVITGIMKEEMDLAALIMDSSDNEAYDLIVELLGDTENEGRFTSAAVALHLVGEGKTRAIMGRLTSRERVIKGTIAEHINKDAEYLETLTERMQVLEPILRTKAQLATKLAIAPETELKEYAERGRLDNISPAILRLAKKIPSEKRGKVKAEKGNPWQEKFEPISEWDKAFHAFVDNDKKEVAKLKKLEEDRVLDRVTIYVEIGKKPEPGKVSEEVRAFSFWVPNYEKAALSPEIKQVIDRYAVTFVYWLAVMFGSHMMHVAGPKRLAEAVEKTFKTNVPEADGKKFLRPEYRAIYGEFEIRHVLSENEETALKDRVIATKKDKDKEKKYMGIAAGTGYACGVADATGAVMGYCAEAGMAPIDMYEKAEGHRVSKLEGAQQKYSAQYALLIMAPQAGIDMERQTQFIAAIAEAKLLGSFDFSKYESNPAGELAMYNDLMVLAKGESTPLGIFIRSIYRPGMGKETFIKALRQAISGQPLGPQLAALLGGDVFAKLKGKLPEEWLGIVFEHISDNLMGLAVEKNKEELKRKAEKEGNIFSEDALKESFKRLLGEKLKGVKEPKDWTAVFIELFANKADIKLPEAKKEEDKKGWIVSAINEIVKELAKSQDVKLKEDTAQWVNELIEGLTEKIALGLDKAQGEALKKAIDEIEDADNPNIQDSRKFAQLLSHFTDPKIVLLLKLLRDILQMRDLSDKIGDDGLRLKYVRALLDAPKKRGQFKKYFQDGKMVEETPQAVKYLYNEAVRTEKIDKERAEVMYHQIGRYFAEGLYRAYKLVGVKKVILFGRMVSESAKKPVVEKAQEILEKEYGLKKRDFEVVRADDLAEERCKSELAADVKDRDAKIEEAKELVTEYGQAIGAGYAIKNQCDKDGVGVPGNDPERWERYVQLDLGGSDMKMVAMRIRTDENGNRLEEVLYTHKHVWDPRNFKDPSVHISIMKEHLEKAIEGSSKKDEDDKHKDDKHKWVGDPLFTLENVRGISISWAGQVVDGKVAGEKARIVTGLDDVGYEKIKNIREIMEKEYSKPTILLNDGDAGAVWAAVTDVIINKARGAGRAGEVATLIPAPPSGGTPAASAPAAPAAPAAPPTLIEQIFAQYGKGGIKQVRELAPGLGANQPRSIKTDTGEFVLVKSSLRKTPASIEWECSLFERLKEKGFTPVPQLYRTSSGAPFVKAGNDLYKLYEFKQGAQVKWGDIKGAKAAEAAKIQALYHNAVKGIEPQGLNLITSERLYPLADLLNPSEMRAWFHNARDALPADVFNFFGSQLDELEKNVPARGYASLPQLIIHGDYNSNNILFAGDSISGLIDFDYARKALRITGLANGAINIDWNSSEPLKDLIAYLRAYQENADDRLTPEELKALPEAYRAWFIEGAGKAIYGIVSGRTEISGQKIEDIITGSRNNLIALDESIKRGDWERLSAELNRTQAAAPAAPAVEELEPTAAQPTPEELITPPAPGEAPPRQERGKGSVASALKDLYGKFRNEEITVQRLIEARVFSATTVRKELEMLELLGLIDVDRKSAPHKYILKSDIRNLSPPEILAICAIPGMDLYDIKSADIDGIKAAIDIIIKGPLHIIPSQEVTFTAKDAESMGNSRMGIPQVNGLLDRLLIEWEAPKETSAAAKAAIEDVTMLRRENLRSADVADVRLSDGSTVSINSPEYWQYLLRDTAGMSPRRVIKVLVDNASDGCVRRMFAGDGIKGMGKISDGRVGLFAFIAGNTLVIKVKDNGPGVKVVGDEVDSPLGYGDFPGLMNSCGQPPMGIRLARTIVEYHGGTIEWNTPSGYPEGFGTEVTITLPVSSIDLTRYSITTTIERSLAKGRQSTVDTLREIFDNKAVYAADIARPDDYMLKAAKAMVNVIEGLMSEGCIPTRATLSEALFEAALTNREDVRELLVNMRKISYQTSENAAHVVKKMDEAIDMKYAPSDISKAEKCSVFKRQDVRGVAGTELSPSVVSDITRGFCTMLRETFTKEKITVIVGRDARISSPSIQDTIIEALRISGVNVIKIEGPITTPMLYWAVDRYGADAGLMVTASHMDAMYNGIKLALRYKDKGEYVVDNVSPEQLKKAFEFAARKEFTTASAKGALAVKSPASRYQEFIQRIIRDGVRGAADSARPLAGRKIVIDSGNGASFYLAAPLRNLGATVYDIFAAPEGIFANHTPNPDKDENVAPLAEEVKARGADLGICFDCDGDRVRFVDERGEIATGDETLMFLIDYRLRQPQYEGDYVVINNRTSWAIPEVVNRAVADTTGISYEALMADRQHEKGQVGRCYISYTGHVLLMIEAKRHEAMGRKICFVGEDSGHTMYPENSYFDDGTYTAAQFIIAFANGKGTLTEKLDSFPNKRFGYMSRNIDATLYPEVPLHKREAMGMNAAKKQFAKEVGEALSKAPGAELNDTDGARVTFFDERGEWLGHFLMRGSNADPVFRIRIEARNADRAAKIARELLNAVRDYPVSTDGLSEFIEYCEDNAGREAVLAAKPLTLVGIPDTGSPGKRKVVEQSISQVAASLGENVKIEVFPDQGDEIKNYEYVTKLARERGAQIGIPVANNFVGSADSRAAIDAQVGEFLACVSADYFRLTNPDIAGLNETLATLKSREELLNILARLSRVLRPAVAERMLGLDAYNSRMTAIARKIAVPGLTPEAVNAIRHPQAKYIVNMRADSEGELKLLAEEHRSKMKLSDGKEPPVRMQVRFVVEDSARKAKLDNAEAKASLLKAAGIDDAIKDLDDLIVLTREEAAALSVRDIYSRYVPAEYEMKRVAIIDSVKAARQGEDLLDDIVFMEYEDIATPVVYDAAIELLSRGPGVGTPPPGFDLRISERGRWFILPKVRRVDYNMLRDEIERYSEIIRSV
ncbi:MAG: phosphotransferase [Candidatus Omnitrophica bacterium]|nr:phosphotransferase [Candidatus Omnitrophota bacterium]